MSQAELCNLFFASPELFSTFICVHLGWHLCAILLEILAHWYPEEFLFFGAQEDFHSVVH